MIVEFKATPPVCKLVSCCCCCYCSLGVPRRSSNPTQPSSDVYKQERAVGQCETLLILPQDILTVFQTPTFADIGTIMDIAALNLNSWPAAELHDSLTATLYYRLSSAPAKLMLATAMHHTVFVPYSVTTGCSLTGNTHEVLPVLCCYLLIQACFQALHSWDL